jgi:three-Cys-motif partner protein
MQNSGILPAALEYVMDYTYGTGPSDVDEFFRVKRSWSKIKDKIVGDYIDCYLKTVHNLQRPILIVDGFAGPGRFGDETSGSPLIICNAITKRWTGQPRTSCLFADAHSGHRAALERNLSDYIQASMTETPYEECVQAVTRALDVGAGSTIFFYLDPYGIKDLEFEMLRMIYERDRRRSTEVLINFNFRTFMRMSGNWKYGDSASEVARKVKEGKTETVNRVMGGDYWQNIITDNTLNKIEREEAVINEYLARVRQFFSYAYAIPVKERKEDDQGIPDDELARYHLIFGTRNARAVVYMNDVALNALSPYLRQFKENLLFDFTPQRYQSVSREAVKMAIVESIDTVPRRRPDIYDGVIPQFFMHYWKKDYRATIDDLTFKEGRVYPDRQTMKTANRLNDDTLLSTRPWPARP